MKILNVVFIILFLVAAALQYNDPDPYLWIPIYLLGAFLCFKALQGKFHPLVYYISLAGYIAYAVFLFFDKTGVLSWANDHGKENIAQSMKAGKPWIEETREFFGLLILIVVITINLLWLKRKKPTK